MSKKGDIIRKIYLPDLDYMVEYIPTINDDESCHWVDLHVYELENMSEPIQKGTDWIYDIEWTKETVLDGWVKWDGCMEFSTEGIHLCGFDGVIKLKKLFEKIYKQVAELCNVDFKELKEN